MTVRHLMFATLASMALAVVGCTAIPSPSTRASALPSEACAGSECTVHLQTQPSPHPGEACEAARIGGVLTADADWGLGLKSYSTVDGVLWPFGYSARREPVGIVLVDRSGRIVAREGDRIAMAGFQSDDRVNHPCYEPDLEVVP